MNTGKIASGTLLILFLIGLAVGLFLVVTGHGIASEYMGKGGGGLAVLLGWGLAAAGYFTLAVSSFAAGLPWAVIAIKSKKQSTRNNESDPFHAENAESSGPKSTVDSDGIPKT